ncbi:PREDICTED: protein TIFY 5A-like [Tarenaya hassleriana]|uniref:protein TIFY 5A-like n=1 Tax=Tarenaya hassleriana TaxID=28532 RepID=UPI00053C93F5|nr:PREDICTED: protein TIFY 5A-like [Tarenaya hassleriana]
MMKMESNCDLELRLLSSSFESDCISSTEDSPQKEESQRITIFYNGKMCVSDVTDLQAKAIISLANRRVEERSSSRSRPNNKLSTTSHHLHQHSHHHHHHHHHHHNSQTSSLTLQGSNSAAFMKRSLQRFLQNRRDRIQASCPYHSKGCCNNT